MKKLLFAILPLLMIVGCTYEVDMTDEELEDSYFCSEKNIKFEIKQVCKMDDVINIVIENKGNKAIYGFEVDAGKTETSIEETVQPGEEIDFDIEGTAKEVKLTPLAEELVVCIDSRETAKVNVC